MNEEFSKSVFQRRKKSINFNIIMTLKMQNAINEIMKQYINEFFNIRSFKLFELFKQLRIVKTTR